MNYYAKFFVFPVYMVLMLLFVLYVTLNTKKLRFKYSFDSLPIIMALYLFHVFVCLGVMKGGIIMLVLTSLVMAPIVISTYRMQIIGVTGSIGSGKSTVSKMLNEEFKLPLIDCDILARRVVEVGKPAYNKIVKEFGTGVLEEKTKEINRKALGEIVFADNAKRKKLTKITGLYIALEILKDLFIYSRSSGEPIVLDAPILFESKYLQHICFPIIVVDAGDEALQVKRVMARDNLKKEEVQSRISSQMPISIKLKKADIKLINNTEVADLRHSLINQLYPYLI